MRLAFRVLGIDSHRCDCYDYDYEEMSTLQVRMEAKDAEAEGVSELQVA